MSFKIIAMVFFISKPKKPNNRIYKNLVEFILQTYFISYTKIGSKNKIPNPSPIAGRENHGH